MNKILCQIKGHGNLYADFVCLGNCDNELKLACSQCKTFQHSKCGLKCVLQNDLKQFFSTQESLLQISNENKYENDISTLLHHIEESFKAIFQQNKKSKHYNYTDIEQLIKYCKTYKDQYPYGRKDCEDMNKYFHDKINIEFKNNQIQFSLKLRIQEIHQQIDQLIVDSVNKIKNIFEEFNKSYYEINNQSIFLENQPQKIIKIVEIQQNKPVQQPPEQTQQKVPQLIKEFKFIKRQGQKFGILNDTIQNEDVDDQLIIFEPKINSSEENLCWKYKIREHGWIPIVFQDPINLYNLGIGVVGANYINNNINYKKSENQQYLVFSQGTTNFKSITGFKFTQSDEVTLKYYVQNRTLEIKGARGSVMFQLDNSDYYPCLVLSKKDQVILIQPKDMQQYN